MHTLFGVAEKNWHIPSQLCQCVLSSAAGMVNKNQNSDPKPLMVAHTCNISTSEAEAREFHISGQPGLHNGIILAGVHRGKKMKNTFLY